MVSNPLVFGHLRSHTGIAKTNVATHVNMHASKHPCYYLSNWVRNEVAMKEFFYHCRV